MSPPEIASVVLVCVFGSALLGLGLQRVLPEHHLTNESKDVVKLGTGLIATMSALVLSLLISSAKGSFDRMNEELVENAAKVLVLDRTLAEYGPETKEVRGLIKAAYARRLALLFSGDKSEENEVDGRDSVAQDRSIQSKVLALSPRDGPQRGLQAHAVELINEMALTRALMFDQREGSIPMTLLVVLVTWLSVIFAAFGLFAPRNGTVVATLFVCALSASGAVLLILEMNTPFDGFMNISSAPMVDTLRRLDN